MASECVLFQYDIASGHFNDLQELDDQYNYCDIHPYRNLCDVVGYGPSVLPFSLEIDQGCQGEGSNDEHHYHMILPIIPAAANYDHDKIDSTIENDGNKFWIYQVNHIDSNSTFSFRDRFEKDSLQWILSERYASHGPSFAKSNSPTNDRSSSLPLLGMTSTTFFSNSNQQGQHRSLTHLVAMDVDYEKHIKAAGNDVRSMEVQITMMLLLDNGVYMDMDAVFGSSSELVSSVESSGDTYHDEDHNVLYSPCLPVNVLPPLSSTFSRKNADSGIVITSCNMEVVENQFSQNHVIDIEQPTFVSPQNVVTFRISLSLDIRNNHKNERKSSDDEKTVVLMSFLTNLHFRYPKPIDKRSSSTMAIIPTPESEIVHVMIKYQGDDKDDNMQYSKFQPFGVASSSALSLPQVRERVDKLTRIELQSLDMGYTKINSGFQEDFWVVQLLTLFVSFSGALILLRAIAVSEASYW